MIHAIVSGNLGRDPELKQAGSGQVCEFSIASNSRTKIDGQWQNVATWVRCTIWGKRGESLAGLLGKGSYVTVRGELSLREYTSRQGEARTSLEMRADEVELGPKRDAQQRDYPVDDAGRGALPPSAEQGGGFQDDSDLPF